MKIFERHVVTQEQFLADPLEIASSPELYVAINGDMYRCPKPAPRTRTLNPYIPTRPHGEAARILSPGS